MSNNELNASDKKAGNGNGNSVINNHEYASNYVSGDSASSSSSKKFGENTKNKSKKK